MQNQSVVSTGYKAKVVGDTNPSSLWRRARVVGVNEVGAFELPFASINPDENPHKVAKQLTLEHGCHIELQIL